MAAEFVIVGRRDLPERARPWELEIQNQEGGIAIYEAAAVFDERVCLELTQEIRKIVEWQPQSVVFIRKAWELAEVVAEELATALEGVVYCDINNVVFFDAAGANRPVTSIPELEERLKNAFNNPQPFFDRWHAEALAQSASEQERDPSIAAANDWSDVK